MDNPFATPFRAKMPLQARFELAWSGARFLLANVRMLARPEGKYQTFSRRPPTVRRRSLPDLPDDYREAMTATKYGRYVLAGIFTSEEGVKQRWDDYYGISTPELSFQMIFNHAAALRTKGGPRKPGGALVCLAGGSRADELNKLTDEEIEEQFRRDLVKVLPELRGKIDEVVVKRQPRVVPYRAPGDKSNQSLLFGPLGPILFAGDHVGEGGLPSAADSGYNAAQNVLKTWK